MAKLDFPPAASSPFTAPNGVTYTYIGVEPNGHWSGTEADGSESLESKFVEIIGDNMTGNLTLGTDKITLDASTGAATFGKDISFKTDDTTIIKSIDTSSPGYGKFNFRGVRGSDSDSQGYLTLSEDNGAEFTGSATFAVNVTANRNYTQRIDIGQNGPIPGGTALSVTNSGNVTLKLIADGSARFGIPSANPGSGDDGTIINPAEGILITADNLPVFRGYALNTPLPTSQINSDGTITATKFVGDGSSLTNLTGGNLQQVTDAGNTTTNGASFGGNVLLKDALQFTKSTNPPAFEFEYISQDWAKQTLNINELNSDGTTYPRLSLQGNGSTGKAVFDGSITAAGSVKSTNGSGAAFLGATSGTGLAINDSGNNTVIELNYDGSSEFKGGLQVGGAAPNEAGVTINTSGSVFATQTTNASTCFAGFLAGNATATSYILSDGTASFVDGKIALNTTELTVAGDSLNAANYGVKIYPNGFIEARRASGASIFEGYATGSATKTVDILSSGAASFAGNVNSSSDIALKDNIEVIPDALDKLSKIRGVTYNRIDMDGNPRQAGVIAQEVEQVLPEVVSEGSDGYKSVAYGNLVSLLIEAVKEQQVQINELKNQLK